MPTPYLSLVPEQIELAQLTSAQRRYLCCIAQEGLRLSTALLKLQQRQRVCSSQMLTAEPEFRRYLISLLQILQYEQDLLLCQWQLLASSVETTTRSWKQTA